MPEAVDGLNVIVAPHAGAWIETSEIGSSTSKSWVAPHAGAWIEIALRSFTL